MLSVEDKRNVTYENKRIQSYLYRNEGPGMGYFSEITPNIFVSNVEHSLDVTTLKNYNITKIINLSGVKKSDKVKFNYKKKKIDEWTIVVGDSDSDPIDEFFYKSYTYIINNIQKNRKILIHGQDGISRPIAIVAYYLLRRFYVINYKNMDINEELMSHKHYYLIDIIKFIKMARACANPNSGFVYKLVLAELELKKEFEPKIIHFIQEEDRLERLKNKEDKKEEETVESESENSIEDNSDLFSEQSDKEDFGFTDSDESVGLYTEN